MSSQIQPRWSALTDSVLRKDKWLPGRSVPTDTWEHILREHGGFEMHDAARQFLTEFGGLVNDGWPSGPVTARTPFRLDPLTAEWDHGTFAQLSARAGTYLYPVGQANRRTSYLGMDPNGAIYIGKDSIHLVADTADEALEKLVETRCTDIPLPLTPTDPVPARSPESHQEPDADARQRWSPQAARVLCEAGWRSGRSVPTATWEYILREEGGFEIHEAARLFLAEFGGLAVDRESDRTTGWRDFRLNPLLARWDLEIFEELSEEAGTYLYPLGMADRRNFYLGMAEDGTVYVGMDYLNLLADTGDKALEKLIEG
ncbi:SUKH-3 domain-containing protein [Streptomyces sp. BA2]|uniref:SUKH-3 domain-containing protein n=1 Tax=Streptomyces sp. BA2 TaxID=436595 RepID=UPI00132C177A|nr:SUKH-3 domain-containing protein [Streptomyces sp. BA2]MWA13130.1 hypothetical protein [Streptomyces sp. BA2]